MVKLESKHHYDRYLVVLIVSIYFFILILILNMAINFLAIAPEIRDICIDPHLALTAWFL